MATLTLSSTTTHAEALALSGALLEWCTIQPVDPSSYTPAKVYCQHHADGSMSISTKPPLELVK